MKNSSYLKMKITFALPLFLIVSADFAEDTLKRHNQYRNGKIYIFIKNSFIDLKKNNFHILNFKTNARYKHLDTPPLEWDNDLANVSQVQVV